MTSKKGKGPMHTSSVTRVGTDVWVDFGDNHPMRNAHIEDIRLVSSLTDEKVTCANGRKLSHIGGIVDGRVPVYEEDVAALRADMEKMRDGHRDYPIYVRTLEKYMALV
jgi:hypothetical protein